VANHVAYSAAYWLGSAAEELYVAPSGGVGSIGVVAVHEDRSGALAQRGIKPTYITSSKYKAEGNPTQPLDKEAKAEFQREVDGYHGMFIEAVAASRGVDSAEVEADYGQGRTVRAKDALERGMVDGVHTLDSALQRTADLAANRTAVVSPAAQALTAPVLEPFATRLERVLAEAEALAAHAHERSMMRAEQGRKPLSSDTRGRLVALQSSLDALVAAAPAQPMSASRVQYLDLMIRNLQENT
jgi:ClpP class serine protease